MDGTPRLLRYILLLAVLMMAMAAGLLCLGRSAATIEAVGGVQPARVIDVRPQIAGIVRHMLVREGDKVADGQVLLVFDDSELQAQLVTEVEAEKQLRVVIAQLQGRLTRFHVFEHERRLEAARGSVELARVALAQAEDEWTTESALSGSGLTSPQALRKRRFARDAAHAEYDAAGTALAVLEAQLIEEEAQDSALLRGKESELVQCQTRLGQVRRSLTATDVRASGDGVVLTADPERLVGQHASEGQSLLAVADLEELEFLGYLTGTDVRKVIPGQQAKLRIDGFPHHTYGCFEGEVVAVAPQPRSTANGLFYVARITIPRPWAIGADSARIFLRPGMSGTAEITVEKDVSLLSLLVRDHLPGSLGR
jgi:HlyD family secretion protein